MNELRFAIFGKGGLTAARAQAIVDRPDTSISGAWTAEQASAFTEADWRHVLSSGEIDAAIFALPPGISAHASMTALDLGLHVLNELPGGQSVEDIVELRDHERKSRSILKFGCGLRYHRSVQAAVRLCAREDMGRLLTARAIYGHAGFPGLEARESGILAGHGIHMVDLLHLFCGPFESVKALSSGAPGNEDNMFAILKTGSGSIAQLHASATSWRQTFRLELGFEEGYVWLDGHLPGLHGYTPEMLIHARLQRESDGRPRPNPDETIQEFTQPFRADGELAEFIDAIAGRRRLRHGRSEQAFDAVNIVQRISAATEAWA